MTADELDLTDRLFDEAAAGGAPDSDPMVALLASLVDGTDDPFEPTPGQLRAFGAAVEGGRGRSSWTTRRLVPAVVVGGSLVFGGVAAASNGSLPDPLQHVAHELGHVVGLEVPRAEDVPGEPPANAGGVEGIGADGTAPGEGGGGIGVGADGASPGQGGVVPGTGEETGGVEVDGGPAGETPGGPDDELAPESAPGPDDEPSTTATSHEAPSHPTGPPATAADDDAASDRGRPSGED